MWCKRVVLKMMVLVLVGMIPQTHPAQTMVMLVPTMSVMGLVFVCIPTTPIPAMTGFPALKMMSVPLVHAMEHLMMQSVMTITFVRMMPVLQVLAVNIQILQNPVMMVSTVTELIPAAVVPVHTQVIPVYLMCVMKITIYVMKH